MRIVQHQRDPQGGGGRTDRWGTGAESLPDDGGEDPLGFETVILPARVDTEVARRVAIAANRDGISVADLLGRAAAAYDWGTDDEAPRGSR
jgi:hypothetical protein